MSGADWVFLYIGYIGAAIAVLAMIAVITTAFMWLIDRTMSKRAKEKATSLREYKALCKDMEKTINNLEENWRLERQVSGSLKDQIIKLRAEKTLIEQRLLSLLNGDNS